MFQELAQHLETLFHTYGVVGVLLAASIEEILAPIPSTIIVFTASILMTKGLTGSAAIIALIFKVILPASVGMTIGSLFPYYIAKIGERIAIDRFGKYVGIDWSTIEKMQAWIKKSSSDEIIIFGARAIPGIPTMAVSILAGLTRIPVTEYLLYTFLGCIIRTSILASITWYGGKQYRFIIDFLSTSENHLLTILTAVLCSMIGVWIVVRYKKSTQGIAAQG